MHTDVDIIELLERDHRRIRDLAERLDSVADTEEIRDLYRQIVDGLLAHEAIENQVLFPAFRAMLDADGGLIEQRSGEHDELNGLLAEMQAFDAADYAFTKRGSAFLLEMEGHFAEEEATVFAPMRERLSPGRLLDLGRQALAV